MAEHLFPFLWLHGEDDETLRRGVQEIADSGCRAFCVESRTHPDFLGESWWHEMEVLLKTSQDLNMRFYLLDDTHFPSGFGNGVGADTPYQRMMLTEMHMDFQGPQVGGRILVKPNDTNSILVAVIAGRKLKEGNRVESFVDLGGFAVTDLLDLTDRVQDGMIQWDLPDGTWRVFVLTASYVSERNPPQKFLNPLLPDASRLMIETIYQPHLNFFGDACGKTFLGFFSDEPALRAGRGSHAVLGEFPNLPIPWRLDMIEILQEAFGKDARTWLPGLWYEAGPRTHEIRYALMDTVSRLYAENYSQPLGDWCMAHGLEYVGHVIEQNNAHSRLGQGAGHFFRALSGQTMAGMDLVLHELRPSFRDHYHAWKSQDFEAEDAFFRYMLPQMTLSSALLDERKHGRALCEIFGAYGWQEDVGEMRYLANLLLCRGINYFVPHAFSLKPFPDPDSPPHFGACHPQQFAINRLFQQMEKVASLIDGGQPVVRVAVLYYAEIEWLNGSSCMKTQEITKILWQKHIPFMILPAEKVAYCKLDLLLIPEAATYPASVLQAVQEALSRGINVICFHRELPESSALPHPVIHLPLNEYTLSLNAFSCVDADNDLPWLGAFEYETPNGNILLLMNEHDRESFDHVCTLPDFTEIVLWDPEKNTCVKPIQRTTTFGCECLLHLHPGQLLVAAPCRQEWPKPTKSMRDRKVWSLSPTWRITMPAGETLVTDILPDPLTIDPHLFGTIVYETELETDSMDVLELPEVSGSVQVFVNQQSIGFCDAAPYRFACHVSGHIQLRIEVTPSAVYRVRDALSMFEYIPACGLRGEIHCIQQEEEPDIL